MNIFAIDTSDAGVLRVSGAYMQPRQDFLLPGSGEIFYVNFQIDEYADSGSYALEFEDAGYQTYDNHLSDTTGLSMIIPILSDGEIEIEGPVFIKEGVLKPDKYASIFNYPNPFNNRTSFRLNLQYGGGITFEIFNVSGQKIRTIEMGALMPGEYKIEWDGRNDYGKEVASGVYCYALFVDNMWIQKNKMILLK